MVTIVTESSQKVFVRLIEDLVSDKEMVEQIPETLDRLERILRYNVSKKGVWLVPTAFKKFCRDTPSQQQLDLSNVLGWCWAILQESVSMMDDYLDDNDSRNGLPTWWSLNEKDPIVINDIILLEHVVWQLLQKYFEGHSAYPEILRYISKSSYEACLGQSLDHHTTTENDPEMTSFTTERYRAIVRYTGSGHNYLAQLRLAMILAEYPKPEDLWRRVEQICENIGYMKTVETELNCAFAPEMGISADCSIKLGKCTWLLMKAKEKSNSDQWNKLKAAYGKNDPTQADIVKAQYKELGLEEFGKTYVANLKKQIKIEFTDLLKQEDELTDALADIQKLTGYFC